MFQTEIESPLKALNTEELQVAIQEETKPLPEEMQKLKDMAENNVASIMSFDGTSLDNRQMLIQSVETFGISTMKRSSDKNSLLQTQVTNLSRSGDEGGLVVQGISELHRQLKDLDPGVIDFTKTGLLGRFFNPVRQYFNKYEKADSMIAGIIDSMEKGRKTLSEDNTTLQLEQHALRDMSKKLQHEIQIGIWMDQSIEKQIVDAANRQEDTEKIRFITEEVLHPLRQRVLDMQKMLVVNQQGIMASEVVIRNNKELIRGVDRSKVITVTALRTSVMVASALYNQKIVLNKLQLVDKVTDNVISGTSKMLKMQGAELHKTLLESSLSVDTLKQAFVDAMEAFENISEYKRAALPKMKEAIQQFETLSVDGEAWIRRLEQGNMVTAKQIK